MKKFLSIIFIALLSTITSVTAQIVRQDQIVQTQTYSELIKANCYLTSSVDNLIASSVATPQNTVVMNEYINNEDSTVFRMEMGLTFFDKEEIPPSELSGDIWSLISKQLNGEQGTLSTTHGNIFPTYLQTSRGNEEVVVFVCWSATSGKWKIGSMNIGKFAEIYKGVRVFTLQNPHS